MKDISDMSFNRNDLRSMYPDKVRAKIVCIDDEKKTFINSVSPNRVSWVITMHAVRSNIAHESHTH